MPVSTEVEHDGSGAKCLLPVRLHDVARLHLQLGIRDHGAVVGEQRHLDVQEARPLPEVGLVDGGEDLDRTDHGTAGAQDRGDPDHGRPEEFVDADHSERGLRLDDAADLARYDTLLAPEGIVRPDDEVAGSVVDLEAGCARKWRRCPLVVLAGDLEDRDDLVCCDRSAHVRLIGQHDGAGYCELPVCVDLLDQLGAGAQELVREAVTLVLAQEAVHLPDDQGADANDQHAHGERDLDPERTDESAEPHGRIVPSRSAERLKFGRQASSSYPP